MPPSILAAEAEIEGGDAEVIEERRVVRARAERADAQVGAGARFLPVRPARLRQRATAAPPAAASTRTPWIPGSSMSRATPLMNFSSVCEPSAPQEAAAVAIGVDVDRRLALQFGGVRLRPLGGAEQARFLAVPRAVDDGALGLPALLEERAERAHLFHQRPGAGDRIFRAVDPGVVMIAADDPLVGELAAGNAHDHVVERLGVPVELQLQVHLGGPGTDVIGDGQRAAPGGPAPRALRARPAAAARRRRKSASRESW